MGQMLAHAWALARKNRHCPLAVSPKSGCLWVLLIYYINIFLLLFCWNHTIEISNMQISLSDHNREKKQWTQENGSKINTYVGFHDQQSNRPNRRVKNWYFGSVKYILWTSWYIFVKFKMIWLKIKPNDALCKTDASFLAKKTVLILKHH